MQLSRSRVIALSFSMVPQPGTNQPLREVVQFAQPVRRMWSEVLWFGKVAVSYLVNKNTPGGNYRTLDMGDCFNPGYPIYGED